MSQPPGQPFKLTRCTSRDQTRDSASRPSERDPAEPQRFLLDELYLTHRGALTTSALVQRWRSMVGLPARVEGWRRNAPDGIPDLEDGPRGEAIGQAAAGGRAAAHRPRRGSAAKARHDRDRRRLAAAHGRPATEDA